MRRLSPGRGNSPKRCINSELKELADTQRNRVAIYAVGNSDRFVTHAVGGLQENGCVKHLPFLGATRSPEILQPFPIRRRYAHRLSLRDEWHVNHSATKMFSLDSFQQNVDLVEPFQAV
jgi:hypothetical protein